MRRSASLLAAATLAAGLAAAGAARAVDWLGPSAAQAAADGKCLQVSTVVDTANNQSTTQERGVEVDCPDGAPAGSVSWVTYNDNPPTQQAPGSRSSGFVEASRTITPQPPYFNPYTTTVVKPTPKTASTTTPAKH
jgi:hypothetical protein